MPSEDDGYELALAALSRKERTESEIAEWLRERDLPEAEIADAVARLAEAGAIDDAEFARRYAEDKRELRGWGPDRITEALRARGVGEDEIGAALAAESEEAVIDRALALLAAQGAAVDDDRARGRALSLLARRGYPLEAAYEAVRRHERGVAESG
jgi:regulatory protein